MSSIFFEESGQTAIEIMLIMAALLGVVAFLAMTSGAQFKSLKNATESQLKYWRDEVIKRLTE